MQMQKLGSQFSAHDTGTSTKLKLPRVSGPRRHSGVIVSQLQKTLLLFD